MPAWRALLAALPAALAALLLPSGCARPPASAYVAAGATAPAAAVAIGRNAVGETCTLQEAGRGMADIYCGTWQQPSAHLRQGEAAVATELPQLAAGGPWRAGLDARYACEAPTATSILGDRPAQLLACTARRGGWPHAALVALVEGHAWYADGVLPAVPVMERAIGVRAGLLRPDAVPPSSAADALLAQRLAARSVSSGDIGQYDALMVAGTRANLAGNDAAAEAAFRAALALQQKALGAEDPNTATATMTLALQLSNEGRYVEASRLFERAEALAPRAADPIAPARLLHYRGLDAANQGNDAAALALLDAAAARYSAALPQSALHPAPVPAAAGGFPRPGAALIANQDFLTDPAAQAALLGLVEVQRNRGLVLRRQGRLAESRAALAAAADLAAANGLVQPIVAARLYRSEGVTAAAAGQSDLALRDLALASRAFDRALPQSRPVAETALLRAGELLRTGQAAAALAACRAAVADLRTLGDGAAPALLAPCLDAYGRAATALPDAAARQTLLAEMAVAAQLAQSGVTSRQIAQATARLAENARDPRVAAAIRRREDAAAALQALYRRRDETQAAGAGIGAAPAQPTVSEAALREAQATLADADAALQAASPNFAQLTQLVVSADTILTALAPHEALAQIVLGPADGWVLLLHDGRIDAGRVPLDEAAAARLVARLRASIELTDRLPAFDVAAARALYDATLGPVAPALAGITRLVVVPSGALLAVPFEVLLTGPADPAHLAAAPFLLRHLTLTHVPAPGNFVSLRRVAGLSRAPRPWFGFGDFVPLTLTQAQGSFPGSDCGDSARLLASLPPLPGARRELAAARALLGGGADAELLGPAFTVPAVLAAPLKQYRVLHFAAHALLPAELRCQSQPAIVTSAPAGATDATGALLTSADVTGLDLDAELVILSACNSGGGGTDGTGTAGESLSGLARAFFYAGARALLVTHWSVNDQVAAYLVANTLARLQADPAGGVAGALRTAQLALLDGAGHDLPAEVAHPFFWAPFAVIGEGGGTPPAREASLQPQGGL
jgi:CHAT domain-containing protein